MITSQILQAVNSKLSTSPDLQGVEVGYLSENSTFPFIDIEEIRADADQIKMEQGIFTGDIILNIIDESNSPSEVVRISKVIFKLLNQSISLKEELKLLQINLSNILLRSDSIKRVKKSEDALFILELDYFFIGSVICP